MAAVTSVYFWIKGGPGTGGTMLLCGIISDLERSYENS